jgi:hypothetical protein
MRPAEKPKRIKTKGPRKSPIIRIKQKAERRGVRALLQVGQYELAEEAA